jgi:uncharacterized membrane protein
MPHWIAIAIAYAVLAVLEATWLFSAKPFYARQFAGFAPSKSLPLRIRSVPAAVAAYIILAVTFWALVLKEARSTTTSAPAAALRGATYGLAVYGVYNLTNKATLEGYSWTMVAVDSSWGAALFGAVAFVFRFFS